MDPTHRRTHRYTRSEMRALMRLLKGHGDKQPLSLKSACEAAGVSYSGVLNKMRRDAGFAKAINHARSRRIIEVEDALYRMATTPGEKGWGSANFQAAAKILDNQARESWSTRPEAGQESAVDADVRRRANEISERDREVLREQAPEAILGPPSEETH